MSKPFDDGAYAHQRLNLGTKGKAHGRNAKASNRTCEMRLSGIIGGPRETQPWWNCEPASQTERARTVTLHLPDRRARALSQPLCLRLPNFWWAVRVGLPVPFVCNETHELGEELVGPYRFQFISLTGSNPTFTASFCQTNDLCIKVKRMVYLSDRSDFKAGRNYCAPQRHAAPVGNSRTMYVIRCWVGRVKWASGYPATIALKSG